jgi:hypothetical protein
MLDRRVCSFLCCGILVCRTLSEVAVAAPKPAAAAPAAGAQAPTASPDYKFEPLAGQDPPTVLGRTCFKTGAGSDFLCTSVDFLPLPTGGKVAIQAVNQTGPSPFSDLQGIDLQLIFWPVSGQAKTIGSKISLTKCVKPPTSDATASKTTTAKSTKVQTTSQTTTSQSSSSQTTTSETMTSAESSGNSTANTTADTPCFDVSPYEITVHFDKSTAGSVAKSIESVLKQNLRLTDLNQFNKDGFDTNGARKPDQLAVQATLKFGSDDTATSVLVSSQLIIDLSTLNQTAPCLDQTPVTAPAKASMLESPEPVPVAAAKPVPEQKQFHGDAFTQLPRVYRLRREEDPSIHESRLLKTLKSDDLPEEPAFRSTFETPAQCPLPYFYGREFGEEGRGYCREGLVIESGMVFALTKKGDYQLRFIAQAPATTVTLRLQLPIFKLVDELDPPDSERLNPFPPFVQSSKKAEPGARFGLLDALSEARAWVCQRGVTPRRSWTQVGVVTLPAIWLRPDRDPTVSGRGDSVVYLVVYRGYSATLEELQKSFKRGFAQRQLSLSRIGTARFGETLGDMIGS